MPELVMVPPCLRNCQNTRKTAMLNESYNGSSESTAHYFHTRILSNYFLLNARPLLGAYFLAVSCYKLNNQRLTVLHGLIQ